MAAASAYSNWDREAATSRALKHADASGASVDGGHFIWNFAFGSNLSPDKVRSRGMKPASVQLGVLRGWSLLFNHNGGFGNIETVEKMKKDGYDVSRLSPPAEVHGALLLFPRKEFANLAWEEYAYDTVEVAVEVCGPDGSTKQVQQALAFKTNPCALASSNNLPSARYIGIIRQGARAMGVEPSYCDWLEKVPSR